jgi:hypothetical protein
VRQEKRETPSWGEVSAKVAERGGSREERDHRREAAEARIPFLVVRVRACAPMMNVAQEVAQDAAKTLA